MTPRAVLWLAVVLAEVGACVLAVRWGCSSAAPMLGGLKNPSPDPQKAKNAVPRSKTGALVQKVARLFKSPVAFLLFAAVVIDLAVGLHDPPSSWGLSALAAAGPRPRVGLARAAYHLADALVMAWPGLLAATCGRVFGHGGDGARKPANRGEDSRATAGFRWRGETKRRPSFSGWNPPVLDILLGCYLGAVVGLAALYPLGHARTQALLLAWEAVALAFAAGAIFAGWRRVAAGGAPWTRAHGVLLVLVPVEAAVAVIGPFARENVFEAWDVARWQYLAAFVVVACVLAAPRRRR